MAVCQASLKDYINWWSIINFETYFACFKFTIYHVILIPAGSFSDVWQQGGQRDSGYVAGLKFESLNPFTPKVNKAKNLQKIPNFV